MKTLFIFLFVLLAFYSCDTDEPISAEDLSAATGTNTDEVDVASRSGSYLIWLNGMSAETKKVADQLQTVNHYDKMVAFNDLPGTDKVKPWKPWQRFFERSDNCRQCCRFHSRYLQS